MREGSSSATSLSVYTYEAVFSQLYRLPVKKLTEFLDCPDSDYRRIQGYFECLAFRPHTGKVD